MPLPSMSVGKPSPCLFFWPAFSLVLSLCPLRPVATFAIHPRCSLVYLIPIGSPCLLLKKSNRGRIVCSDAYPNPPPHDESDCSSLLRAYSYASKLTLLLSPGDDVRQSSKSWRLTLRISRDGPALSRPLPNNTFIFAHPSLSISIASCAVI